MIHFFVGTKAQFIKTAPLMVELSKRDIGYRYIDTGQHAELTRALREQFKISEPDVFLRDEYSDITSITCAATWYFKLLLKSHYHKTWLRKDIFPGGGVCVIHGDTLSTLMGLQMARCAGLSVAHVEAGLRSNNLLDPFPEELIRIYCMKKAHLLLAPSSSAAENLKRMGVKGHVHVLPGNTGWDAVRLAGEWGQEFGRAKRSGPYVLATCHRLETISNQKRLSKIIEILNKISSHMPVIFVMHKPTEKYLQRFGLISRMSPSIEQCPMLEYGDFIQLLSQASGVMTDGGSIQEECAFLRKPCLILRMNTEREDGIGDNAVLWNYQESRTKEFLAFLSNPCAPVCKDSTPSPTKEAVDIIQEFQISHA